MKEVNAEESGSCEVKIATNYAFARLQKRRISMNSHYCQAQEIVKILFPFSSNVS